jgi:hypothetical protein
VTRARLRLYATDSSKDGPAVHRVDPDGSWSETGITWNTKPTRTGAALGNLRRVSSKRYVEYDVTDAIAGNGSYSFNLVGESSDALHIASREATNPPELVLQVEPADPVGRTSTFGADADASVSLDDPDTNFGAEEALDADHSNDVGGLLRFAVSGLSGEVIRAHLRLYVTDTTRDGPAVHLVDPDASWTESGVTGRNRPRPIGGVLDDLGRIGSKGYVEFDVTGAVTGDGTYTFTLVAESSDGVSFKSREASSDPPELVVETD